MEMSIIIFFIYLLVISPLLEWCIHYELHKTNNRRHKWHHKQHHEKKVKFERWPIYFIIFFVIINKYYLLIMLIKYFVVHSIIHFKPDMFPNLTRHHFIHHKHNNYNYCVSAIWPDKLFVTHRLDY